jgi:transposase
MHGHLLPHLTALEDCAVNGGVVFMQDNAPCHKAHSSMQFLANNNIRVLEWPPCSPDLNQTEKLWSLLKRSVHSLPQHSRESVILAAHAAWNDCRLPYTCHQLAISMVTRIQKCIDSKGGYTHY